MVRIIAYGTPQEFGNYDRALRRAGAEVGWTGLGAAPEDYDALLLVGGVDVAAWRMGMEPGPADRVDETRDEVEFALTAHFLAARKPILGVCRGVQLLNVALGGTLYQHIAGHRSEGRGDSIHGTDVVHWSAALAGSRMARLYGERVLINSCHHQALRRLGEGLYATMWADDGMIEAVEHHTLPVWGVQWHPERFTETDGQKVYNIFVEEAGKII